jgi:hypothetical protein
MFWPFKKNQKRFRVKIVKADPQYWHKDYIGAEFIVSYAINPSAEEVKFLYRILPIRENKKVLRREDWWRTKATNAWGYYLNVHADDIEITKEASDQ